MQVHTAEHPDPRLNRLGSAVEPMTCPPDAQLGPSPDHPADRRLHDRGVADHRFLAEIWGRTQKWPVGMPGEPAIRTCAAV